MSAIYGAIDFAGRSISDAEIDILKKPFERCRIDKYTDRIDGNVYMGCGNQFITKESRLEKLPYYDDKSFFDADMILDNRQEIALALGINNTEIESHPDAELAYKYIQLHGADGLNDLLGAYAFVYYNRDNNRLMLTVDAVGNRCIYYRIVGTTFYYSSLIESLENIEPSTINNRWMSDYIAMDSLIMIDELEETPIAEVKRVAPAYYVTYDGNNIKTVRYWDVIRDKGVSSLRYKTDDEYREEFRKLFFDAVKCVLRSEDKTSILLSGGYDSTAVAAVAAPELAKRGHKLYSYTSVPLKGLDTETRNGATVDESQDVLKTKEIYPNIECDFMDLKNIKIWKDRSYIIKTLEMPYKSIQNLLWVKQAYVNSMNINSRILLMGEMGNTTISYGNYRLYVYDLLRHGHIIKIFTDTRAFCNQNGYNTKYFLKCFWKDVFTRNVVKRDQLYGDSYVNKKTIEKYGVFERLSANEIGYNKAGKSYLAERKLINELFAFRQIGELNTKLSLETGVIMRDPTKDKRIVEFCMRLPIKIFQNGAEWRRLVSIYLKDIMPEHVLKSSFKGMQSADFKSRMAMEIEDFKNDAKELIKKADKNPNLKKIIDVKRLENDIENISDFGKLKSFEVNRLVYTIVFVEYYLNKY